MKRILLAGACAAALSCSGCGGNLIGTEMNGGRPDGAKPVPQSYYLPKGEVPITLAFDESKGQFAYESDYTATSVPDLDFPRFNLWHQHRSLSREELVITVNPKTMLLEKAASIYEPRTKEALDATAALIRQTTELQAALAAPPTNRIFGPSPPPSQRPCNGLKAAGRIPVEPNKKFETVELTPVVAFGFCRFTLSARVEAIGDDGNRQSTTEGTDRFAISSKCAEAVCFRLPKRYKVSLRVGLINHKSPVDPIPQIPPFEVSAPDRTRIAFVAFPSGCFASKESELNFTDGVLATYSVKNDSPVVGTLNVATSALVVATAAAIALK